MYEESISAQPVLLGLLMSQPRHGYELYGQFRRKLGPVWHIGLSQLYAQLRQLEQAGLIVAHTEAQPTRPPRKVYSLTSEGRAAFLEWLRQPTPYLRHMRMELLARIYFFQSLSLPGLEELVAAQKAVCRQQADHYARLAAGAQGFRRLVLEFRRGQLEAVIPWLDRCCQTLS